MFVRCPNLAVQEADDSEPDDEDEYEQAADNMSWTKKAPTSGVARVKRIIEWIGDPIADDTKRKYYRYAIHVFINKYAYLP